MTRMSVSRTFRIQRAARFLDALSFSYSSIACVPTRATTSTAMAMTPTTTLIGIRTTFCMATARRREGRVCPFMGLLTRPQDHGDDDGKPRQIADGESKPPGGKLKSEYSPVRPRAGFHRTHLVSCRSSFASSVRSRSCSSVQRRISRSKSARSIRRSSSAALYWTPRPHTRATTTVNQRRSRV